jgi:hypothetical protein
MAETGRGSQVLASTLTRLPKLVIPGRPQEARDQDDAQADQCKREQLAKRAACDGCTDRSRHDEEGGKAKGPDARSLCRQIVARGGRRVGDRRS